jgi:uncharacterized protein YecT (DUF1311 family)
MNECYRNSLKKAEKNLNTIYDKIIKNNAADSVFTNKFKAAQDAWVAYRDAQLSALYPHKDEAPLYYGSVYTMCYYIERRQLSTSQRIEAVDRGSR